ncbi:MAG: DUF177 domain-containing protein [Caldilineaceae bacterium]
MQFNVAQLLKEPTGSSRRYQLAEDVGDLDPELQLLAPLNGDLQMIRTNSGVLVRGKLRTVVRATCNRCLEPIALPVHFEIEENFRPLTEVETGRYIPPEEFEGETEDLEDAALLIDEHHILDIREVVRQDLWLALPMYPGCNWEGASECPNLAAMRQAMGDVRLLSDEEEGNEAAPTEIDPRWAALLNLRNNSDTEE